MQGSGGKIKRNRDKTRPKTSATYRLTLPWEMAHKRLSGDVGVGVEVDKETQREEGRGNREEAM